MLRLIVHADDLGLSARVNEGILQAHRCGILTSASIMANGSASDHAVSICRTLPTLDVGIHLTLVEEQPSLTPDAVPSLVDPAGKLHPHATTFMKKYLAGGIRLEEVGSELEAQIQKVISHGITVSHLDSHQHLHMLPQILNITIRLAGRYGIPVIRLPREPVQLYMFAGTRALPRVLQLMLLNTFCYLGKNRILRRPDHFVGFRFSGRLDKNNLQTLLQSLPCAGTCELMCHPGLEDPDCRYRHWGYHWQEELSALLDPEISDILRQKDIRLVSYRQLHNLPC